MIQKLGPLRVVLFALVLLLIVIGPFSGTEKGLSGIEVLTGIVAPAVYVIMLFVLPLDMLMSRIFMTDKEAAEQARLRFIIRLEAALLVLMLLAWLPFLLRLLSSVRW